MPTQLEQTYLEIGRLYVQSIEFSERVQEYLEILEFAEFSEVVDFAAASGKARKKPNCTPGKSHHCPGKGGAGACVSMNKQCKVKPSAGEKQAAEFTTKAVAAKKGKAVKEVAPKTPKAAKSKAKKVEESVEPVAIAAVVATPAAAPSNAKTYTNQAKLDKDRSALVSLYGEDLVKKAEDNIKKVLASDDSALFVRLSSRNA